MTSVMVSINVSEADLLVTSSSIHSAQSWRDKSTKALLHRSLYTEGQIKPFWHFHPNTLDCLMLTFLQLLHAGDLGRSVDGVYGANAMWKVEAVAQGAREVSQQRIERPEPVPGDGVHDAFEVTVTVAVETHFLGFLLRAESLQRASAAQAAVGTVRRAQGQPPP